MLKSKLVFQLDLDHEPIPTYAYSSTLSNADFKDTLNKTNDLLQELPQVSEKAKQVQKVIDDLGIPAKPIPVSTLQNMKRRRSSMLPSSQQPEMSPKQARTGLLARLEKEARKK